MVSLDEIVGHYLPVLIRVCPKGRSSTFDVMLGPERRFVPHVPMTMTAELMHDSFALHYLSGALVHHVAGLVRTYEIVRDAFTESSGRDSWRLLGLTGPVWDSARAVL